MPLVGGCGQAGTLSPGGPSGGSSDELVSIRGKTFTIPFGDAGVIDVVAGEAADASTSVRLFDGVPAETPETGVMGLLSSSVAIASAGSPKKGLVGQALPLTGSATVGISIVPGSAPAACAGQDPIAEYQLRLMTGIASVRNEVQPLSQAALTTIAGNDVTVCAKVTADFDGQLTLEDFVLTFDGGESRPTFVLQNNSAESIELLAPGELFNAANLIPPGGTRIVTVAGDVPGTAVEIRAGTTSLGMVDTAGCPDIEGTNYVATVEWSGTAFTCVAEQGSPEANDGTQDSETIQVPVNSVHGVAVPATPTNEYGGVDYGVVGVLNAATDAAPLPAGDDSLVVNLETLGLQAVQEIHFATYSAWVPDLPDDTVVAELTLSFFGGQSAQVVPLILGGNTAEWSYERSEHDTLLGGVRHTRPSALYSFDSAVDSEGVYTAHVYGVSVELESPGHLTRIDLAMAEDGVLGARPDAINSPDWAAQSIPALTLVGPAGSPEDLSETPTDDPDGDTGDPEEFGSVSGIVVNAVTGDPLPNAQVTVAETGAGTITDGAGGFSFNELSAGAYTLTASLNGYVPGSDSVTVAVGAIADARVELYAAGTIIGEVVNAQTGLPLSGVEVIVVGTQSGATANASGEFTIDPAPEGDWTLSASLAGYVPASVPVTVVAGETTEKSIGLLAIGGGGDGVAVVLSWDSAPRDLDLHVSGPDGSGGRFHVAFYDLRPVAHASLDLDDVSSFGPETVTISPIAGGTYVPGDYHVWVHNFSGDAGFGASGGVITLFAGGAQFAQYTVEDAAGDGGLGIWRVVEFTVASDGTLSGITPLEAFVIGTSTSEF